MPPFMAFECLRNVSFVLFLNEEEVEEHNCRKIISYVPFISWHDSDIRALFSSMVPSLFSSISTFFFNWKRIFLYDPAHRKNISSSFLLFISFDMSLSPSLNDEKSRKIHNATSNRIFRIVVREAETAKKKKIRLAGDRERTRSFGAFEIRRAIPPSPRRLATNHNHIARARVEKCHCRLG